MGFLGGIANAIAVAVLSQFLFVALSITTAVATIAGVVLGLAIDPSFIRIPYTTGPIIDTGWGVVRDFANMLIVFFLIIIGLATALRLGQYEAKKTLPKLIGVALLINFTPVITGFVVDVSNIFMNFFLEGLAGFGLVQSLWTNLNSVVMGNFTDPSLIFKLVALMAFQIFAAIVFMLFAALFIMRHIAIWILVILSPIAFVASILPRTNNLFKMWWNQFFQWSIIGVFAAFFLWLGDHMFSIAAQGKLVAPAPAGGGLLGSGFITGILNEIMPFGIALAMLLVGFFVALQSSAMGAGATQAFTTKGLKWGGASAGSALWRRWGDKVAAPGAKLAGWGSSLQQWGAGKQGRGGRPIGALASAAGWGMRTAGEASRAGAMELTKQVHFRDYDAFDKATKEVAKMGNSQDVFNTINAELLKPLPNKNRVLGLLAGVRNRGDADDIQDALLKEGGALHGKEAMIGELIKLGRDRIGPNGERPLFKAFYGQIMTDPAKWGFNIKDTDLQRDDAGNLKKDEAERIIFADTALKNKKSDAAYLEERKSKIAARMAPEDFKSDEIAPNNYNPETPEGRAFLLSMLKERGAELAGPVVRRREKARREAIGDFFDSIKDDWLGTHAPDMYPWYLGTAARNLGIERTHPDTGDPLTQKTARGILHTYQATQKLERSIASIQRQLTELNGKNTKTAEDMVKIKEFEEQQTRKQAQLTRIREQNPASSTTPPSGDTSTGPTGSTGPGGMGPRPGGP